MAQLESSPQAARLSDLVEASSLSAGVHTFLGLSRSLVRVGSPNAQMQCSHYATAQPFTDPLLACHVGGERQRRGWRRGACRWRDVGAQGGEAAGRIGAGAGEGAERDAGSPVEQGHQGLPAGRYRVSALTVRTKRWYSKPRVSKSSFRIGGKTKKVTVRVSYWDTIANRTRRAKKGADLELNLTNGDGGTLQSRARYPVGSVVASPPTGTAPEGYLLRITGVDGPAGGPYTYRVETAALTEAIPRGNFSVEMPLDVGPGGGAQVSADQKKLATCSGSASASAELALTGDLPVVFDADWSLFGEDSFTVTASPKVELRAKAALAGSGSCKINEHQLWKRSFKTFVVWVGPVPVVITPELTATAGANATATGSATAEAAVGLSGELKARASSSGLSVSKQGPNFSRSASVTTEASGNVFAYGKAYFTGKLYGLVGPYVSLTVGPEVNVDINANPWWKLGARVKGGVGIKVPALKIDKSKDDLYNGYFGLLDAGGPLKKPSGGGAPAPTPPSGLEIVTNDLTGSGISSAGAEGYLGDPEQFAKLEGLTSGGPTWVLTTGRVGEVNGEPEFFASTDFELPGNDLLSFLSGEETHDAALYAVDVVPAGGTLRIRYIFASEEYPEFVDSDYNDVMAVLVNGSNCALVPGTSTPVSVNGINHLTNSDLYIDNSTGASGLNTVFDGVTVPLTCTMPVTPGVPAHIVFGIADASDGIFDSAIALPVDSISSQ